MPMLFRHHVPPTLVVQLGAEALVLLAATSVASLAMQGLLSGVDAAGVPACTAAAALACLLGMVASGVYQRDLRDGPRELLLRSSLGLLLGSVLLLPFAAHFAPLWPAAAGVLLAGWLGVLAARLGCAPGVLRHRVLVLGTPAQAASLRALRRASDRQGSCFVGFIDGGALAPAPGQPTLAELVRRYAADEVVVALPERRAALPLPALLECKLRGVRVALEAEFIERHLGRVALASLAPGTLVFDEGFRPGAWRRASQRLFDLLIALPLLALALPLMAVAAGAIWLEDGGPVFYVQQRTGLHGRPFRLWKFRSMRRDAEADGQARWAAAADDRVTRVGRFLRRTRIDELPQLLNVLAGDMSLVGPRPERPTFVAELQQQIPWYALRHHVRPGLTGWAQVRYSYGASVADARAKLEYDLYYLKHASLFLDLDILLHTAQVLLWGRGVR